MSAWEHFREKGSCLSQRSGKYAAAERYFKFLGGCQVTVARSDGKVFFVSPSLYFPWWGGYKALLLGWVVRARHVFKTPPSSQSYSTSHCIKLVLVSYLPSLNMLCPTVLGPEGRYWQHLNIREGINPVLQKKKGSVIRCSSHFSSINSTFLTQWCNKVLLLVSEYARSDFSMKCLSTCGFSSLSALNQQKEGKPAHQFKVTKCTKVASC